MINQLQNMIDSHEKAPEEWQNPLPDEKPLWFHRFCLYRDLGPKRSLRAALAKEQEQFTLLPSEEAATESHEKPEEKKVAHVPGSWKQASVTFHWKARCKTFDQAIIQTVSEEKLQQMGASMANRFARINRLSSLADTIYNYISKESNRRMLNHKEFIAYTRLLRDLVKDAKGEMQGIDDQTLLSHIAWFTTTCYFNANWTPEKSPFAESVQDWKPDSKPDFFHSVVEAIGKVKREARDERL